MPIRRLEQDTKAYFNGLTEQAAREEDALAESLKGAAEDLERDAIDPETCEWDKPEQR